MQHTATHCNTLQHTATHCNTLQHHATQYNTLQHTATHFRGGVYGWPSTRYLGADVSAWTARNSVGYRDLLDTGLFRNDRSVIEFLEFYSKYHFLKPEMVRCCRMLQSGALCWSVFYCVTHLLKPQMMRCCRVLLGVAVWFIVPHTS